MTYISWILPLTAFKSSPEDITSEGHTGPRKLLIIYVSLCVLDDLFLAPVRQNEVDGDGLSNTLLMCISSLESGHCQSTQNSRFRTFRSCDWSHRETAAGPQCTQKSLCEPPPPLPWFWYGLNSFNKDRCKKCAAHCWSQRPKSHIGFVRSHLKNRCWAAAVNFNVILVLFSKDAPFRSYFSLFCAVLPWTCLFSGAAALLI